MVTAILFNKSNLGTKEATVRHIFWKGLEPIWNRAFTQQNRWAHSLHCLIRQSYTQGGILSFFSIGPSSDKELSSDLMFVW